MVGDAMAAAEFLGLADGAAGVRQHRARLDLTQSDLARRSGVNRQYISEIERGKATPSVVAVAKLAAALEVTVTDLIGR